MISENPRYQAALTIAMIVMIIGLFSGWFVFLANQQITPLITSRPKLNLPKPEWRSCRGRINQTRRQSYFGAADSL